MAQLADHGGECCGVQHIYGFWNNEGDEGKATSLLLKFKHAINGRLIEVILNEKQMLGNPQLRQALKDLQFKRVTVFRNSVHDDYVHVFHCRKGSASDVVLSEVAPY